MQAVSPAEINAAGDTAIITAIPTTTPRDEATSDLVHSDATLPQAIADTEALVGGPTAGFIDQSDKILARLRCSTCCRSARPTGWWSRRSNGAGADR